MTSILHMDLDALQSAAHQVLANAQTTEERAQALASIAHSMDWQGSSRDMLVSEVETIVQALAAEASRGRDLAARVEREIAKWVNADTRSGQDFATVRSQFSALLAAGLVLGAQTTAAAGGATLAQQAATLAGLPAQITALSDRLNALNSAIPSDATLASVEAQIAALQLKRAQAQSNAESLINHVLPDLPLAADDDPHLLPWYRSQADNYEDEVARLDQELKRLESVRSALQERQQVTNQLANAQAQQTNLQNTLAGFGQNQNDYPTVYMGSNGTIQDFGCRITATSMFANYFGKTETPATVNDYLRDNKGYTPGTSYAVGSVETDYVRKVLDNKALDQVSVGTSTADIEAQLEAGQPVILHVPGTTSDGHYVLATHVDASKVIQVYDPWYGGAARPLTDYSVKSAYTYAAP